MRNKIENCISHSFAVILPPIRCISHSFSSLFKSFLIGFAWHFHRIFIVSLPAPIFLLCIWAFSHPLLVLFCFFLRFFHELFRIQCSCYLLPFLLPFPITIHIVPLQCIDHCTLVNGSIYSSA